MDSDVNSSGFRCVQCGFPVEKLYVQYSPGNIRLMKCISCKAVVDEYIECEIMILIIDLILHKQKAYRHLFFNRFSKETLSFTGLLWKSSLAFLILDIYRLWILNTDEKNRNLKVAAGSSVLEFGKLFGGVVFGNLTFSFAMIDGTRKLLSYSERIHGWKEILLVILVSSYFKIFLMAMLVWEFPSSVIFIVDLFVISSNYVALKVATNSVMLRCLAVCIAAHGLKFLVCHGHAIQRFAARLH